ncbi:hypothetical protein [Candidatus Sororendozoicomonas aggregata]|uniref:hypothetical protein n=1 Tax=Candidatus Sororendozoicomonas aggregata TaxID=3073239 RepID=UPI002ED1DEDB
MKKTILYFSLPALMLWATANVYASSCMDDFKAIANIVHKSRVLVTGNGVEIGSIIGPVTTDGDGSCSAQGKTRGILSAPYKLHWPRGKWKSPIVAYPK